MVVMSDKAQHAIGGALVAAGFVLLLWLAAHAGIAVAMLAAGGMAGAAFEVVQRIRGEGQPDWRDALATAGGAALVALAWHLVWPLVRPWLL